uniref:Uncharacterized protein n=1 Tax=Oryza punctata TaxID=4537 RepID=A0A0E0LYW2_ORYPU
MPPQVGRQSKKSDESPLTYYPPELLEIDKKTSKLIPVGASVICWAIWLRKNDIVFLEQHIGSDFEHNY